MAKRSTSGPFNGLIPITAVKVPITNVVPPRPPQHAVLMNPLGIKPSRSRVIAGMSHAMAPAAAKPENS